MKKIGPSMRKFLLEKYLIESIVVVVLTLIIVAATYAEVYYPGNMTVEGPTMGELRP